ncbi:hypothetical protein ACI798_21405 [Geodermatophilus sp. SYSU D01045]
MQDGRTSRLQDQLRQVEAEIDRTRRAAEESRAWVGQRAEGATDPEDRSAAIAEAELQEALLGVLTRRRDRLLDRMRDLDGAAR